MNILVLANDFPTTSRMPGSPRLFNLCRALAREHVLSLAFFPLSQEKVEPFRDDPDSDGVYRSLIELPTPESFGCREPAWWREQLHRLSCQPYFSQQRRFPRYVRHVRRGIQKILQAHPADLVFVSGHAMPQYVDLPRHIPQVVDLCDCLPLIYRQEADRAQTLRSKASLLLEAAAIGAWERHAARKAHLTTVISEVDQIELLRLAPGAKTIVVPNGIDTGYFQRRDTSAADARRSKPRLIFTGVMSYGPNADAALDFAQQTFPLVREKFPEAELWLVGASPPAQISTLAQSPGVHVTGFVPDIRQYLQDADIFVCPLRYGTGMKNKILAALAMELPVIASKVSLAGLPPRGEEQILVADTPREFLAAITALAADNELAARLRQGGRKLVVEECSWDTHGARFSSALHEAKQRAAAARRN